MNIAIIPARGGSKRIKGKNIKFFLGKPIISYAIKCAKESKIFDKIIVSSDNKEIIKVANKFGAETPFVRPKNISKDTTSTIKVIKHAIKWLQKNGDKPKFICCIYATTPLMKPEDLKNSFKNIKKKSFVISAAKYSYPIQRSFYLKNNKIKLYNYSKRSISSQKLEATFHDAGQFYWGKVNAWLNNKSLLNNDAYAFKLPQLRVQDIDDLEDWKIAEKLFKLKYK
tara:strand:+ start:787 stop:1464 length:678 start_codon:yes stop_codon:yes gene_type:complete